MNKVSTKEKGDEYENFVREIQKAIFKSEEELKYKNIEVILDKRMLDCDGRERQFDLYWEYEIGGIKYETVIECKNYSSKIGIQHIDEFVGKLSDFKSLKGLYATKIGYQEGAKKKAKRYNIDLLTVREMSDEDWVDEEGNALIKEVNINLAMYRHPTILSFKPVIDKDWLESAGITSGIEMINAPISEIWIEDKDTNMVHSLLGLQSELKPLNESTHGIFEKVLEFKNSFFRYQDKVFKIKSARVMYQVHELIYQPVKLDFASLYLGVVEYLKKGEKRRVLTDNPSSKVESIKPGLLRALHSHYK
ncbi:hypothetical protein PsalN5692_04095 (plasmid) [Piscirickettsia salmonis]|uniref:restriction endonuclease n=1 Tax=Piscirickettsia salmonis TaxID=1238 RepID=UPI0012B83074|nr:restriction endonuclease [Piscirickettsia salmonis]QGP52586.1 hypothetical protein PsalN5692_04095 [Piscirickettsia salmonis]